MRKLLKNNKGVTLIVLIITMIIIFILVGATINMIAGEEGILRQSYETKNMQQNYINTQDSEVNSLLNELNELRIE